MYEKPKNDHFLVEKENSLHEHCPGAIGTALSSKFVLGGGHESGLRFSAGSTFYSVVSGWKEFLFAINGWENAYVCGFQQLTINIYDHTAKAT